MTIETTTPNNQEFNMNSHDLIRSIFDQFIDAGGSPKVTEFKRHIDQLIKSDIKPLCSGRGKGPGHLSNLADDWRNEQKALFSGRGAKWVKIPLDQIEPALKKFEKDGIDCSDYRAWTTQAGYAWVRYSGPRVMDNVAMAAFEVRTRGSKEDHPKQLHLRYNLELMEGIERLENTPHSLKLEVIEAKKGEEPVSEEPVSEEPVSEEPVSDETVEAQPVEVNEPPTSDDPAEWEAFLEAEGLGADLDDDDNELFAEV